MKRTVFAVCAALVTWVLVASLLDRGLRYGMSGYAAAEPVLAFTLGMQLARLAIAALSSLAAGALTAWIAPQDPKAPWIAGLILLAGFLPMHVKLWQSFPLWYHLSFLVTLLPWVVLGARLRRGRMLAATPAA
jgi:hypothetical protein